MLATLLELLFPESCVGCDELLEPQLPGLCRICQETLVQPQQRCPLCLVGAPHGDSICGRCRIEAPPFSACEASYIYGGQLAGAVQQLKYQRKPHIARGLGALMLQRPASFLGLDFDGVVPIPSHNSRMRNRGFNPAAQMSRYLARQLGLVFRPTLLRRRGLLQRQVGLKRSERRKLDNPRYWSASRAVRGLRLLLIDDVITTGSTVLGAARALRIAGAEAVYAWALALTTGTAD